MIKAAFLVAAAIVIAGVGAVLSRPGEVGTESSVPVPREPNVAPPASVSMSALPMMPPARLERESPDDGAQTRPIIPEEVRAVEKIDSSGVSHEGKIKQIITVYDAYQLALTGTDAKDQTTAEFWLAVRCAIAILREEGEAQYALDVDSGSKRGFSLDASTTETLTITADQAKYKISTARFPAVALARERRAIASDPNLYLNPLTQAERELYEECARSALATLGVGVTKDP